MAFYLHRAFASVEQPVVLNDLRIVDPDQPGPDGQPGVAQIDHLVLHTWGAFIVESKSVTHEVTVSSDGSGGDEWTRRFQGRDQGFPSPIQQAVRQGLFLRALLQRNRENLLGKMTVGTRTLARLFVGTDQRGFSQMPIQVVVAISDTGKISRVKNWTEQTVPFRTFVCKADLVPSKILAEIAEHRAGSAWSSESSNGYGVWQMKAEEVGAVAQFLISCHVPPAPTRSAEPAVAPRPAASVPAGTRESAAAPLPSAPTCKHCGSRELVALRSRYGFYWRCRACSGTTDMPERCSICGALGRDGKKVVIRKNGPMYERTCEACGITERIWTERPS